MVIDERARRLPHERAVAVLGEEEADILMAHLPPVGWADVATKHDLVHLREVLEARVDALVMASEARQSREMARHMRVYLVATMTAMVTVGGVGFAGSLAG